MTLVDHETNFLGIKSMSISLNNDVCFFTDANIDSVSFDEVTQLFLLKSEKIEIVFYSKTLIQFNHFLAFEYAVA